LWFGCAAVKIHLASARVPSAFFSREREWSARKAQGLIKKLRERMTGALPSNYLAGAFAIIAIRSSNTISQVVSMMDHVVFALLIDKKPQVPHHHQRCGSSRATPEVHAKELLVLCHLFRESPVETNSPPSQNPKNQLQPWLLQGLKKLAPEGACRVASESATPAVSVSLHGGENYMRRHAAPMPQRIPSHTGREITIERALKGNFKPDDCASTD